MVTREEKVDDEVLKLFEELKKKYDYDGMSEEEQSSFEERFYDVMSGYIFPVFGVNEGENAREYFINNINKFNEDEVEEFRENRRRTIR